MNAMYLMIEFEYDTKWENLDDDQIKEIIKAFPSASKSLRDKDGRQSFGFGGPHGVHLMTNENVHVLQKHNLKFSISTSSNDENISQMLVKLQNRISDLELDKKNKAGLIAAGAAVQIHVPDFILMQVTEVLVENDCCTEMLQSHLDEGWRILAVCPPNGARRPDYVLGRRKISE